MNITQKELRRITNMVEIINKRLEKYNKRMDKVIKETKYPMGITYDELSENIIQISGPQYSKEIQIKILE